MSEELPEGWAFAPLSDLACPSSEKVEPGDQPDVPYLSLEHIEPHTNRIIGKGTGADVNSTKSVFRAGDVLYGKLRPYLNKVAIPTFDGICSTDMLVFQKRPHLDSGFLLYFLSRREVVEFAEHKSAGVQLPRISFKGFGTLEVPLPPLAEQRRIVAAVERILAEAGAARERLGRVPATLKRFRQSVLAAACSGRLTADWRESDATPEKLATVFLADLLQQRRTLLGNGRAYKEPLLADASGLELPESWTVATVDAISTKVVDGVHRKPNYVNAGVPFVTVRNLTAGPGISFADLKYITQADHEEFSKRANPEVGDILITKDGTLGVVRAVRTRQVFSLFVSVALIKPITTSMTDYIELALCFPQVQDRMVHTGTGLQHIHLRDLRGVTLPIPPLPEQREIVRRVSALFALADDIEAKLAAARRRVDALTQSVLAKAFRGELVPTEAGLARREGRPYEPASALLERIRDERAATPKPAWRRK